jgi:hypothetical protein
MEGELVVELMLEISRDGATTDAREAKDRPPTLVGAHDASDEVRRNTPAIASALRCQTRDSARRRARPAGVIE